MCVQKAIAQEDIPQPPPWPTPHWAQHPDALSLQNHWVIYKKSLKPQTRGCILVFTDVEQIQQILPAYYPINQAGYDFILAIPEQTPSHIQYTPELDAQLRVRWQNKANDIVTQRPVQEGIVILLFAGIRAYWGIHSLTAKTIEMPTTLILFDAFYPQINKQKTLLEQLIQLQLPILDLTYSTTNSWIVNDAKQRQWAMQRIGAQAYYEPFRLNHIDDLGKRIYGWLAFVSR